MERLKEYKMMTPQEQLAWLTDFRHWTEEKLPILCAIGNAWESNSIKAMEEGLKLLTAFGYCRDFVEKSLLFRDFARRIDRMMFYIEKIKGEVARGNAMRGSDGQTLAYVPAVESEKKRRGRPTRLEAEMKRREQQAALIEQGLRAQAVAKTEASAANTPEIATPKEVKPGNLAAAIALSQGEARLHLDQLAWLLSRELQEETKQVAALRATAAKESNQAKQLADRGVPAAIIEPHSRAAVDATGKYKAIYTRVDTELAQLYSLLTIGGEHTPAWEERCRAKGITLDQLKSILLPYWEKMDCPTVQLESVTPSPTDEPLPTEEELKARAADLHRIRTYFIRKDARLTPKRVEKMKAFIAEARSLGAPTEEYEAILDASIKELEAQISNDSPQTPADSPSMGSEECSEPAEQQEQTPAKAEEQISAKAENHTSVKTENGSVQGSLFDL